ncbi:hypothetical protein ACQKNS_01150 [Peribacillus sp. NPDC094092]|uniref:hypothetical protein n=1 Tax=Peribacillus sp. NPDC094092 TaxID=3390611 RepID=UPI003D0218B3
MLSCSVWKQGDTSLVIRWVAIALDSTSRFPLVVKALILSNATLGAAVVSMEES